MKLGTVLTFLSQKAGACRVNAILRGKEKMEELGLDPLVARDAFCWDEV